MVSETVQALQDRGLDRAPGRHALAFRLAVPEDGSGYDSANLLTPNVGDANTMIPESKAFMVNVRKA